MNRTLLERSRSMLSAIGLEKKFWVEAVMTTRYLINRSPTTPLVYKTLKEVWFSKKPSCSHLRVFGCEAFVYVLK